MSLREERITKPEASAFERLGGKEGAKEANQNLSRDEFWGGGGGGKKGGDLQILPYRNARNLLGLGVMDGGIVVV